MAGIIVGGLRNRFGEGRALRNVSLSVALADMASEVRRLLPRRT